MEPMKIISLIDEYNKDPRKFTDAEAEVIAQLSKQMNRHFNRESKPFSKAAFELGDMATFGLLPDSMRPVSRGEKNFWRNRYRFCSICNWYDRWISNRFTWCR